MDEFIDEPQRTPEELRRSLENIDRQLIKDLKAERDAIIEQLGQ